MQCNPNKVSVDQVDTYSNGQGSVLETCYVSQGTFPRKDGTGPDKAIRATTTVRARGDYEPLLLH
jgi:hypothetical protein